MNKYRKVITAIVWVFLIFGGSIFETLGGGLSLFASGSEVSVSRDTNMQTKHMDTQITVGEDQSYTVAESITVDFLNARHGIYRYIPQKGIVLSKNEKGKTDKRPYIADVNLLESNTTISEDEENGNVLYKMGDADHTVTGEQIYALTYQVIPKFQKSDYNNAYYNVFPTQWQNEIPAGSTFSVSFPKDFDHEILQLYYGTYGETKDANQIVTTSWDGNTLSGTLNKDLALGEGITFYAPMNAGYFSGTHKIGEVPFILLIPAIIIFGMILFLFFMFGRDEKIIPSIQYQPPADLDSASVGYVIDGSIEDKDLISLIIYWADQGYLTISETEGEGMILYKKKDLNPGAPNYQHTIFKRIFGSGTERDIDTLKYKFDGTLSMAKTQLHHFFSKDGKGMIYTTTSKAARVFAMILSTIPMLWFILYTNLLSYTSTGRLVIEIILWLALLIGMLVFCHTIDKWYAIRSGKRKSKAAISLMTCFMSTALFVGMYAMRVIQHEIFDYLWVLILIAVSTVFAVLMTGFMKKRTDQCIEWMGRLAGLRDFIETAELDRMNELAQGNPEWFYHIIPYAYVFGLSDVFAEKLKGLSLAAPDWYQPYHQYTFFDYYMFNRCMNHGLSHTVSTLTVPQPSTTTDSGSFGSIGGSGGGFSGGGFGGGGGGSW